VSRPSDVTVHPPASSGPPDALLGRRRLLGASLVAGALSLTGCDDVLGEGGPGITSARTAEDPDEAVVTAAVRAEADAAAAVRRLLRSAPQRSRAQLRSTLDVHETHLGLLAPDGAPASAGPRVRLRGLTALEDRLSRQHTDLAVRAVSGQLARVLAAMAAASAQQADVWRRG
jgi:hypothetical protein